MLDKILDIGIIVALAFACLFAARFLKSRKTEILFAISTAVQWAEKNVKGSKMGEEKKREVIQKLEQDGIKVTAWVSKAIDLAVAYLNKTGGWLKDIAGDEADTAVSGAVGSITKGDES
jgi:hypothetical protein